MATERDDADTGFQMIPRSGVGLIAVAQQREIAEVQSKMIVARMNPRNKKKAQDRILQACAEPSLAEKALYCYARGGTDITGETIRLAEVLAQNWGNFEFGIRELEQNDEESTVEAYAWDLETNVSQRKSFHVPHVRYSKGKGNTKLSDPRDIYEMVANQGARRMRACILGVIPPDVKEQAVKQCEETLKTYVTVTPEKIKNMLEMFGKLGVSKDMLEARIQRHIEAITPALVVQLVKVYNSLKDGMSVVGDWFETEGAERKAPEKGKLSMDDLKPGKEENHGQAAKQPDAPRQPAQEKPKSTGKAKAQPEAPTPPAPSQGAMYTEGADPDPFTERDPGQEG